MTFMELMLTKETRLDMRSDFILVQYSSFVVWNIIHVKILFQPPDIVYCV